MLSKHSFSSNGRGLKPNHQSFKNMNLLQSRKTYGSKRRQLSKTFDAHGSKENTGKFVNPIEKEIKESVIRGLVTIETE